MLLFLMELMGIFNTTWATIGVDISITYKHRVDQEFILVNELHSKEAIKGNKQVFLEMRNGWGVSLEGSFLKAKDDTQYGPSSKITLPGILFNQEGDTVMKFEGPKTITELYSPLTYNYESKNQLIEIKILPEVF
ncbi:MAG: hypothetical protein OXB84_07800 [Halobacteriovoraceae bacterium]|nr:hypothetical protein [Halobacteriovoraceae bacterium]